VLFGAFQIVSEENLYKQLKNRVLMKIPDFLTGHYWFLLINYIQVFLCLLIGFG